MARNMYNRLHPQYPYFKDDGMPDLLYNPHTSVIICIYCEGCKCGRCFGSGYLFLDKNKFHNLALELYEKEINIVENISNTVYNSDPELP